MEKLDTVNSKCQTKQVICDPVFFQQIPDTNKGTENQCDQIMSCEFVFENFLVFNNTGTSKIGIEKGDLKKKYINPNWHELLEQEKCSSLPPPRGIFYETQ